MRLCTSARSRGGVDRTESPDGSGRLTGRPGVGGMILRWALCLEAAAALLTPPVGYDNDRFAGRYAIGKNLPTVDRKSGFSFNRANTGEVHVLGGACSEVLGGANLANLLRNGYELEMRAMAALPSSTRRGAWEAIAKVRARAARACHWTARRCLWHWAATMSSIWA